MQLYTNAWISKRAVGKADSQETQVRIHFSNGSGYTIEAFAWKNSFHAQPVHPEKVFPYMYHEISSRIT